VNKLRLIDIPARAINKLRRHFHKVDFAQLDSFLKQVPGVIHVGANTGQERKDYAALGLNVLWVEPIPAVFEELCANISGFANQRAFRSLLAAEDGKEYTFHVSDYGGASSSILDFAKHRKMHPDIHYVQDIRITATTLARLIEVEQIDLRGYGALVMDTQGSELLVLKGAIPVLEHLKFVKSEVADFEAYAGCCQLEELTDFMRRHGFEILHKMPSITRDGVGTYYEVVYRRI